MSRVRIGQFAKVIGSLVLGVAIALSISACSGGESTDTSTAAAGTAEAEIEVARSVLSTVAPDARLLVVQTAQSTSTTETPVWAYLFGSPSTDVTYLVYVTDGTVVSASEYGTGGLTTEEWAAVPEDASWSIDSATAYDNALAVSGATETPLGYFMGLQTFVPPSVETSAAGEALVWYVYFEPGTSGATTSTIEVDAMTGDAIVVP